jgi:IclR family transcriptional regulator, mhp operon transcriptional activator
MSLMGIRSVERALRVLQEMNLQPYTSVARLHSRTGLPKPTLVRILKTLEEQGYVENDPRLGGYQVSALVSSLSSGFHKEPMVVEAGRPWAITITRQHQWPVSISLLDRDAVVVRFSTVPDSAISPFHKTVNMRLQLITRGMGLAYLAFTPKDEFELILDMLRKSDNPEDELAHHPQKLGGLGARVRERGYATRSPEVEPRNSDTIAVPIFNESERVVASLGLTYFISAFGSQNEACERYVPILKAASREISRDLARYNKAQLDERRVSADVVTAEAVDREAEPGTMERTSQW